MNRFSTIFLLFCGLFLSSCGVFFPNVSSANVNQTQVVLSSNNFQVIKRVQGSAVASYILGMGGLSTKGVVAEARRKMYNDAELEGAQAIIGEHTELKRTVFIPFIFSQYAVTTSGYVIEFTGK